MRNSGRSLLFFPLIILTILCCCSLSYADQFRIVFMQDEQGVAARFKPLETYLAKKGIEVSFVPASNYSSAANMFSVGTVTPLASAGEIFFRSLPGSMEVSATIMKALSHGAAIEILSQGTADMAIVKNVVWDKLKAKYPSLASVGEDTQENPDNDLIVAKRADAATVSAVSVVLLSLKSDTSPEARAEKMQWLFGDLRKQPQRISNIRWNC